MDAYRRRELLKDAAKGVLISLLGLAIGILGCLAYGLLPR